MVLVVLHFIMYALVVYSISLLMWWGVLTLHSLVFMAMMKAYWSRFTLISYFLVQEVAGVMILLSASWESGVCLFLLVKTGVSPIHFWVFSVCSEMPGEYLMWFMTVQKLPFVSVLVGFLNDKVVLLLLLGVIFCNLQALLYKSFRQLVILGSTETLGWNLLWFGCEGGDSVFGYVMYTFVIWSLFGGIVERSDFHSVEAFLWVSSAPGMFGFYMKIYFMGSLVESWVGLALMIVTVTSALTWSFLYLTVKLSLWSKDSSKFTGVILLMLNLFMLLE